MGKELIYWFLGTLLSLWKGVAHSFTRLKLVFTHMGYKKEAYFDPAFETWIETWIVPWEFTALAHFDIAKETKIEIGSMWHPGCTSGHFLVRHRLQLCCSHPWQFLIPVVPHPPESKKNLWNGLLLASWRNPRSWGVDLGPYVCRFLAERKFYTLCFGLEREAKVVQVHFPSLEKESYLPWA